MENAMTGQSRDKESITKQIRDWAEKMDRQIELWVQHIVKQIETPES
jgi:hypothetical protein